LAFYRAYPIQQTRPIAEHFDWVHSVDSLKIAQRLSAQRPSCLPELNVCVQANISEESTKSGISLQELPMLCEQILQLPNLRLRGVMAIPAPEENMEKQRLPYQQLYQAVKQLDLPRQLDTFSFGMSGDLEAAIMEGATIIRIGTALFGHRN